MVQASRTTYEKRSSPKVPRDWQDWSIAQLLRERHPELRLRKRVRENPLLEKVTLRELLGNPLSLDAFMDEVRSLPQCGPTQVTRLRNALVGEIKAAVATSSDALWISALKAPRSAEHLPALKAITTECSFFPDFIDALDEVYLRMWRLAQFDPFVYLPSSIPEFTKTREVLSAELPPTLEVEGYLKKLSGIRQAMVGVREVEGLILLDSQVLAALQARLGRYSGLNPQDVGRQFTLLREMHEVLPTGVKCMVTDYEQSGLSPSALVGSKMVFNVMGGYAVLDDPGMIAQMRSRFKAAEERGFALSKFLDSLS